MSADASQNSKAIAAQDFRHTVQEEDELIVDFIRHLERTFRRAYGGDKLSEIPYCMDSCRKGYATTS